MVMVSGPNSSLKLVFSLKRLSVRRQTILRPSLVLILQDEVDGDSFASRTKSRVHFVGDRNSDPSYMGPGADDFRRERSPEHENR